MGPYYLTVRITLVHNPTAGDEDHKRHKLINLLKGAGHEVTYRSKKDFKSALHDIDLVVAAGGDGTVAKVAKHLLRTPIPLTILPVGTANNIARAFGIGGPNESLVEGWSRGTIVRYLPAFLRAPWGQKYCFESAGFGAFARVLAEDPINAAVAMRQLRKLAADLEPESWEVQSNGEDLSGRYLLFEAMNIRTIGPNLQLAPPANPSDQYLDLVTVTNDEREVLAKHLDDSTTELPTRRVRHLRVKCEGQPFHVDDKVWPEKPKSGWIEICFTGEAVDVLVPG